MDWYIAEDSRRKLRQVVVEAPQGGGPDLKFGMLFLGAKYQSLMTATRAVGFFRLDGDPGPFLMVRDDAATHYYRQRPARVAFSFFRLRAGGLMTLAVDVQTSGGTRRFLDGAFGLDSGENKLLMRDALQLDALRVCFAGGDGAHTRQGGFLSGGRSPPTQTLSCNCPGVPRCDPDRMEQPTCLPRDHTRHELRLSGERHAVAARKPGGCKPNPAPP